MSKQRQPREAGAPQVSIYANSTPTAPFAKERTGLSVLVTIELLADDIDQSVRTAPHADCTGD